MKESFIEWNPNQYSRKRLALIGDVLKDFAEDNIKITLRQLYYQLVSKEIIGNNQREYKNLSNLLSQARLAGLIDWDCIEDRARRAVEWASFDTIQECAEQAARGFCLARWHNQPEYVELWCEKDALSSVLRPICDELFCVLMVNRGYSSSSAMYESKQRIERNSYGRKVHIIYLGDFDPSGEDMVRDIRDRFEIFDVDLSVTKLALNKDQVKQYKLPHNPTKMKDSRAPRFISEHGRKSYEVDAIPPKDLQKMVRKAIQSHMDMDLYRETLEHENTLRRQLIKAVERI